MLIRDVSDCASYFPIDAVTLEKFWRCFVCSYSELRSHLQNLQNLSSHGFLLKQLDFDSKYSWKNAEIMHPVP